MSKRFVTIWFRYLKTDWFSIRQPELHHSVFVLAAPDHGRMVITAANAQAEENGIVPGFVLADARAIHPSIQFLDDQPGFFSKILRKIAEWCVRFTPTASTAEPDCIVLDVSGCAHLWGGEHALLQAIHTRLKNLGYTTKLAMADTIGCSWAFAHFGPERTIIKTGEQNKAILSLPAAALRIEPLVAELLEKLGLRKVRDFAGMPRSALRRRFGNHLLSRLDQAFGYEDENLEPVQLPEPYQERLACLEPIVTATGIEIALQRLLETLCGRFEQEQKGIRLARFKAYRLDGKIEMIEIGTNRATYNKAHIFKLFELKIPGIEPALGIELFVLEAPQVEDIFPLQEKLWEQCFGMENSELAELIDRLTNKIGNEKIRRFLPDEHHWPERSVRPASFLNEKITTAWRSDKPRPIQLLPKPEPIQVMAPIPDYPPMLFRYKGRLHKIKKADGPERIEREWWIEEGPLRDYYCVEDEEGCRYWLFRSGHYTPGKNYQWFIHGFFA